MPMTLRRATQWLRRHYPARTPVIVRVSESLKDCHGIALIGEGRGLIRVAKDKDAVMCEVLLEEWAHILRHETPIPIDDEHDAVFWAILSAITKKWRGE